MEHIMKRVVTLSTLFITAAFIPAVASAADETTGVYVGAGITQLSADLDLTDLDAGGQTIDLGEQSVDINMITGRLGYRVNKYIAVEGELGFGLGGDDFDQTIPVDVLGTSLNVDSNIKLDVENYYVGFVRGIVPISDEFEVFGRVGYGSATGSADVTASVAGFTASGSEEDDISGLAYGVGGQFNFTDKDGIRADYTRLEDANIISLSYARRF